MILLSNYCKGVATFRAEAKSSKVFIQGGHTVDPQTAHHSKTGAIDNGKILVTPGKTNIPAVSKSARPTRSMIAVPLRKPSQNRSAALR
jgi:hypothetical protein